MERAINILETQEIEVREKETPPEPETTRPQRVEQLGVLFIRGLLGP
jgi:hypothetical protein